ncbi:PAS domain S-box protein [Mycobacterium sp. NPDC006124]|uniref:sensor domain-containing diguanylate cyclase n=1 Tax=Mycobacterium sp. NPDC006124 TaxID=3156729 RepID=UPI0033B66BB7
MTAPAPGSSGELASGDGWDAASLQDDARRLSAVLDRLPALIGYWDRDLRNVIANSAYVDFFGMTPGEVRGRHIREVLGDEVYTLNLPYIRKALAGEEQSFDRTLVDQQGRTRYTQASYLPDVVDGCVVGFYVLVSDVTARVEAERARDEAIKLFEISMANAPFGKVVVTTGALILQINPSLCALLGHPPEGLVGRDFRDLVHPEDRPSAESDLMALRDGSASQVSSERRYVRRDGSVIWMQRNAVLVPGVYGGDDVIVAQFNDVTARRHAEAELERLALTDQLTGLRNRHALADDVDDWRAVRQSPLGIVYVDLDGFKAVNDDLGHAAGDVVLAHAARLLARVVEPTNVAYRIGGDEFVVLCRGSSAEDVSRQADAVRRELTGDYPCISVVRRLTASVGWSHGTSEGLDALLRAADAHMYSQKPRRHRHGDRGG